jgi:hypothetical protein
VSTPDKSIIVSVCWQAEIAASSGVAGCAALCSGAGGAVTTSTPITTALLTHAQNIRQRVRSACCAGVM